MSPESATVVGRGPAGLMAATLLAAGGVSVHLVAAAAGSLALWSGRMDFRGWDGGEPVANPWEWWGQHGAEHMDGGDSLGRWSRVWALWGALARELGVGAAVPAANRWAPTPLGHRRPVFWAPPWELALESGPASLSSAAVVGFTGFPDFDAELAADGFPASVAVDTAWLPKPPGWSPSWTALRYAAYFDTEPGADWLSQQLLGAVGPLAPELVVVPQVLGIEHTGALWRRLERLLERPVREVGLTPPGVGGMRIERRWMRWLLASGVHLHHGRVQSLYDAGGVWLGDGRRAGTGPVILATGGFLGGGLHLRPNGRAEDPVLRRTVGHLGETDSADTILRWGLAIGDPPACGRQVAGCDPDADGDGGAMCLWTAASAVDRVAPELVDRLQRIGQEPISIISHFGDNGGREEALHG